MKEFLLQGISEESRIVAFLFQCGITVTHVGKRFNTQFDELNQFMIVLMNVIDDISVMKHHKLCLMIPTCRISLIAYHLYYEHN